MASFVCPYALMGEVGWLSRIGVSTGSPYTAQVDENTNHRQPGGEMHHGRCTALPDGLAHAVDVADVPFDERRAQRRLAVPGREIVVDDYAMTRPAERLRGVAADVARAASDQNRRRISCAQ